jgi:hypothetical protein
MLSGLVICSRAWLVRATSMGTGRSTAEVTAEVTVTVTVKNESRGRGRGQSQRRCLRRASAPGGGRSRRDVAVVEGARLVSPVASSCLLGVPDPTVRVKSSPSRVLSKWRFCSAGLDTDRVARPWRFSPTRRGNRTSNSEGPHKSRGWWRWFGGCRIEHPLHRGLIGELTRRVHRFWVLPAAFHDHCGRNVGVSQPFSPTVITTVP